MQSAGKDQCTQCTVHNNAHNILVHSVHSAFDTAHFVYSAQCKSVSTRSPEARKCLPLENKRHIWQYQVLTCFRIQLGGSCYSYSRHFDMI